MSASVAASTHVPSDSLGSRRLAINPTAKCPTNIQFPSLACVRDFSKTFDKLLCILQTPTVQSLRQVNSCHRLSPKVQFTEAFFLFLAAKRTYLGKIFRNSNRSRYRGMRTQFLQECCSTGHYRPLHAYTRRGCYSHGIVSIQCGRVAVPLALARCRACQFGC